MPTTRLPRILAALTLICLALPDALFGQTLPIETRELKMQGSTSGTISLTVPATVGTPYTLTLPSAVPGNGSLIYSNTTTGGLAWSNTPSAAGWSLRWNGTALEWFDPAGSSNPNWALGGNTLTATGSLGATSNHGISIITNNLERMSITNAGVIGINDGANAGATTNIGKAGNTVNILGTSNITGATNINTSGTDATNIGTGGTSGTVAIGRSGGSINTTGTITQTGALNLAGASSPLQMAGSAGTSGDVLVSQGAGATPAWQSINSAIGIRTAGQSSVTAATSATVTGLTTLTGTDAIIVTLEGSTSVTATITSRTAGTGFTVTFSGQYTGTVNYLVIKAQ